MLVAASTAPIRYVHNKNGDEAPRGWVATTTCPSPRNRRKRTVLVGTGTTRSSALFELTVMLVAEGIENPEPFEVERESAREFFLRNAWLLADHHEVGFEYVDE